MSAHRILGTWLSNHRSWFGNARWALLTALLLLPLACDFDTSGPAGDVADEFVLRGAVLDTDSNPVPNARVWVFLDNHSLPLVTTAAADGTYAVDFERGACNGAFEGVRFLAWVSCPDCVAEEIRCPHSSDGSVAPDIEIDVHFRPDAYRVSGTVSDLFYGPEAGVPLVLWTPFGPGRVVATSGVDGTYSVTLAPEDCLVPPVLKDLNGPAFLGRYAMVHCVGCGAVEEFPCGWNPEIADHDLIVWPDVW